MSYGSKIQDSGFSGTGPERAAHVANIVLALTRVDTATQSRKPGNAQFLHYHISNIGLGGTNGAPTIDVRWINEREQPGAPVQFDSFAEASLKAAIATSTITHGGSVRSHNVVLANLATLMGW